MNFYEVLSVALAAIVIVFIVITGQDERVIRDLRTKLAATQSDTEENPDICYMASELLFYRQSFEKLNNEADAANGTTEPVFKAELASDTAEAENLKLKYCK